jgi:hypothetical protein
MDVSVWIMSPGQGQHSTRLLTTVLFVIASFRLSDEIFRQVGVAWLTIPLVSVVASGALVWHLRCLRMRIIAWRNFCIAWLPGSKDVPNLRFGLFAKNGCTN